MRILVCGSRHWKDFSYVQEVLTEIKEQFPGPITLVHGGAPGVDEYAHGLAFRLGFRRERHRPHYERYPETQKRRAPLDRNTEMLDSGIDLVLAFRAYGESRGTDDTIEKARDRGIPVRIFHSRVLGAAA